MPLFVGLLAEAEYLDAVGPVWDDGLGATIIEPLAQLGAVVSGIPEQLGSRFGTSNEAMSRRAIMGLAACQKDGEKTASSICQCMDLRIAPAA
jgi:hypothetical protein